MDWKIISEIVVPIVTTVIGFLSGMFVEKRIIKNKIKGDNNIINQNNTINIREGE